jgi:UDP-N-acetylmuramyl tripeptide synthase
VIVGADEAKIKDAILNFNPTRERLDYFGKGNAAELMVDLIKNHKK